MVMVKGADDYTDKLVELQEAMQRLQLLKQIGAENLIIHQEREIFRIQQDIQKMNEDTELDIMDTLPKKCRFCTECKTDDERLTCFDTNHETCKKKEFNPTNPISGAFLKIFLVYGLLLLNFFLFLMVSNILMLYLTQTWLVFILSAIVVGLVIVLFRQPVKSLYNML
jgi:hypothetical protein